MRGTTLSYRCGRATPVRRFAFATALISACLAHSPSHANIIPIGNPAPTLAEYASDAASLQSSATATSTLFGTLQDRGCLGTNAQAWSCRDIVDSQDYQANDVRQSTATSAVVSAERANNAFDYGSGLMGAFADYTIATAEARAQTSYGSNKAEVTARNAATWSETRIEDVGDATQRTEEDFVSSSIASARSLWTEVIETVSDGLVKLVFSLKLHAAELFGNFDGIVPDAGLSLREGDGDGEFTVQLFDLDDPMEYGDGDLYPYVESYALVAQGRIQRDPSDPNGTEILELVFDASAGGRYSLVSQLALEVTDNARLDLFGTASLDRIEVTPGQQLTFASGTDYEVCDPECDDPVNPPGTVPEPGTLLLGMAAALGMAATRGRRGRVCPRR